MCAASWCEQISGRMNTDVELKLQTDDQTRIRIVAPNSFD